MEPGKISAVIITFNEEANIGRCLDSLSGVADEVIVVDSISTDKTELICKNKGARFHSLPWEGYSKAKNCGNEMALYPYILSIDADEELSPELKASILNFKRNPEANVYEMNRMTNYCGKWIRHGGWYPEWKTRLFKKEVGSWEGEIHEVLRLKDSKNKMKLSGNILHYSYPTIDSHLKKLLPYSSLAAQKDFAKGKKYYFLIQGFLKPWLVFITMYFLRLGFLDGYYGFVIAMNSAFERFVRYTKFRELEKH